jgi:hypothetical protein
VRNSGKNTLHLVLDANEFIFAVGSFRKPSCEALLDELAIHFDRYRLSICRPVVDEVQSNLIPAQIKTFYTLIQDVFDTTIDERWVVPFEFVERYVACGLKRGDAFIAGYSEWVGAEALVSENRSDIVDHPDLFPFQVCTAEEFLAKYS